MSSLYETPFDFVISLLEAKYNATEQQDKEKLAELFKVYPELFDKHFLYYTLKKYVALCNQSIHPNDDKLLRSFLPTKH